MNITHLKIKKENSPLSKAQKTFNRLNNQINKLKKSIEGVPGKMDKIRQFHVDKLMPLNQQLADVKYQTIKQLDYLYATQKLGKRQRATLLDILIEELEDIHDYIAHDDPRYDELQALHENYTKEIYGEHGFEQIQAEQMQAAKNMAEMMFGINLDGIDLKFNSKEDEDLLNERMEQRLHELGEEKEETRNRHANHKAKQKLSPREEAKKQAENASLKTLRELYTELVKKLHPDREHDEARRLEKTELMKQITGAYERKDLATLLLMQINWLQRTDKDPISQPDEVLERYNNVLKMHISKLEDEYRQLVLSPIPFEVGDLNMFTILNGDIRQLEYYLNKNQKQLKKNVRQAEEMFAKIHTPEGLKQYLKQYQEHPALHAEDFELLEMFDELRNYNSRARSSGV